MSIYLSITASLPEPPFTPYDSVKAGVLVFRTTLRSRGDVSRVAPLLDQVVGQGRWYVDLEDCEKVLRIETSHLEPCQVIQLLQQAGYGCEELPD